MLRRILNMIHRFELKTVIFVFQRNFEQNHNVALQNVRSGQSLCKSEAYHNVLPFGSCKGHLNFEKYPFTLIF